jgi:hypothetical protein
MGSNTHISNLPATKGLLFITLATFSYRLSSRAQASVEFTLVNADCLGSIAILVLKDTFFLFFNFLSSGSRY